MSSNRFTYWEEDGYWIGYLNEFPDYKTQGESFDELKNNLVDLYHDLTSGTIQCVRRVAELSVQ